MLIPKTDPAPKEPPKEPPKNEPPKTDFTPPEWMKGIDQELLAEPSLHNMKDLNSLAKSFIHAQKTVGKDKIVKPTAKSSKEEWDNFYKEIGRPEKIEEYGIDFANTKIDKVIAEQLLAKAHELNLLPSQAKDLFKHLDALEDVRAAASKKKLEDHIKEADKHLRTEWGNKYDEELSYAHGAVKEFLDESEMQYLAETGMQNDTVLIKIFNKIGKALGEDVFKGEGAETRGKTMSDLQGRIAEIHRDPDFYKPDSPRQKSLLKESEELYARLSKLS